MIRQLLCWILTLVLIAGPAFRQVDKIGALGNITLSMVGGGEYYGSVNRIGDDDWR